MFWDNHQIIYGEKIGFIGLGKLGMPCAEAIRKKGFHVAGYDVAEKRSDLVEMRESIEDLCRDRDIIFVATPTPHEEGSSWDNRQPIRLLAPMLRGEVDPASRTRMGEG